MMSPKQFCLCITLVTVFSFLGGVISHQFLSGTPALAQKDSENYLSVRQVKAYEFILIKSPPWRKDEYNQPRAVLSTDPLGNPFLSLYDKNGNVRLDLSIVTIPRKLRAQMKTKAEDMPMIQLKDGQGKTILMIPDNVE